MQKRTKLAAGAAMTSAALAVTGVSVASAMSAAKTHTLKFNSVETAQKNLDKTHFADSDKDVQNGKVVGYDVVNGVYHAKTQSITVDFAASLDGGIVYGTGTGTFKPNRFTGTVTGGTGKFKGVKGTLTGKAYGKDDNNEHLTLTYR
jgi:hypothetical protein